MKSYECKACGATLFVNDETSFTTCLYCNNNIAVIDKNLDSLNIKKIIPFDIDKDELINNFNKTHREDVLEAKKVYVPVRFCDYEFDYLMYYQYVVHDSEDGDSYFDTEELVDGAVSRDIIFSNSKIDYVRDQYMLRDAERVDFDPVLLDNVSVECSTFDDPEIIKAKIDDDALEFSSIALPKRSIVEVYSVNYFVTGVKLEDFSTLIPVYIIKTNRGVIYNYPGLKDAGKSKMSLNAQEGLKTFLIIIGLIAVLKFIPSIMGASMSTVYFYMIIEISIVVLAIRFFKNYGSRKISNKYDNYKYKVYSFGDKRKKIK